MSQKTKNLNIIVFNPRHFGNGGCLLQAAQAEIPVIICEGNDSGNWHPNNHIAKTEGDAVLISYDLFKNIQISVDRRHLEKINIETTKCASTDAIVSEQKTLETQKRFLL